MGAMPSYGVGTGHELAAAEGPAMPSQGIARWLNVRSEWRGHTLGTDQGCDDSPEGTSAMASRV